MTETNVKLYPRKILPEIARYLDDPGIILLVGARQVGKTSILHLLMDEVRIPLTLDPGPSTLVL